MVSDLCLSKVLQEGASRGVERRPRPPVAIATASSASAGATAVPAAAAAAEVELQEGGVAAGAADVILEPLARRRVPSRGVHGPAPRRQS